MQIVCLCGSIRHKDKFLSVQEAEALKGNVVLAPWFHSQPDGRPWSNHEIERLQTLHRGKIELADELLVIAPDGRIGETTIDELAYAESLGKPIRFWDAVEGD